MRIQPVSSCCDCRKGIKWKASGLQRSMATKWRSQHDLWRFEPQISSADFLLLVVYSKRWHHGNLCFGLRSEAKVGEKVQGIVMTKIKAG